MEWVAMNASSISLRHCQLTSIMRFWLLELTGIHRSNMDIRDRHLLVVSQL